MRKEDWFLPTGTAVDMLEEVVAGLGLEGGGNHTTGEWEAGSC